MFSSTRSNTSISSDDQSLIDVFEFDDNDSERWLCSIPVESEGTGYKIEDLNAWLHLTDQEAGPSTGRRSIDTRTFTRGKRKSGRLSFDGGQMTISAESKPMFLTEIFERNELTSEPLTKSTGSIQEQEERQNTVPYMLRPKPGQMLSALMSDAPASIDSQASMEAFRNICGSRGFNSSIIGDQANEIDINHMLMNISQPSLLYSSIISDGRDESLRNSLTGSFVDSQILTDSMMDASMFKENPDTTALAEFLKHNETVVLQDRTAMSKSVESDDNRTMLNETFGKDKSPWKVDETFVCAKNNVMSTSRSSNKSSSGIKPRSSRNSTIVLSKSPIAFKSANNVSLVIESPKDSTTIVTLEEIGDRRLITSSGKKSLDTTFQINNTSRISSNFGNESFDKTSTALRKELLQEVRRSSTGQNLDDTFSIPMDSNLDATYVQSPKAAVPVNKPPDATYTQQSSPTHKSESQCTERCMDATFDTKSSSTDTLSEITLDAQLINDKQAQQPKKSRELSRFSTFRKESRNPPKPTETKTEMSYQEVPPQPQNRLSRFSTFIKKSASAVRNPSDRSSMYIERNLEYDRQSDFPFAKPNSLSSKLQLPRQLSKLPQMLQKSNPNLAPVSTTKTTITKISLLNSNNIGFNKGSQPNIAKYHPLSKTKSGSEQKLQQNRQSNDYSTATSSSIGSMGSVESIGSTTSTHSAPDFDDIQSIGSNSSRSTFVKDSAKNLKQVTNTDRKTDAFLDGKIEISSTPKPKPRQILENNWVDGDKDLGSPILKNGIERVFKECVKSGDLSRSDSPEYNEVKTSSPLNMDLNTDNKQVDSLGNNLNMDLIKDSIELDNKLKQMKVPSNTQAPVMRLRQPTNFSGPNKVNGAVSGIPRPASRIPGPKFSRPTLK